MAGKDYICEGDTCPECGEGTIKFTIYGLQCDNCGARWNDRGERVATGDATAT